MSPAQEEICKKAIDILRKNLTAEEFEKLEAAIDEDYTNEFWSKLAEANAEINPHLYGPPPFGDAQEVKEP